LLARLDGDVRAVEFSVVNTYDEQQRRKAAEVWYGPWDATREAIKTARGARECSNVEVEQAQQQWERERDETYGAGLQQASPESMAEIAASPGLRWQIPFHVPYITEDPRLPDIMIRAAKEKLEKTLVDALFEEKHGPQYDRFGGVEDER
jgi:hypothetical protein